MMEKNDGCSIIDYRDLKETLFSKIEFGIEFLTWFLCLLNHNFILFPWLRLYTGLTSLVC